MTLLFYVFVMIDDENSDGDDDTGKGKDPAFYAAPIG